MCNHQLPQNLCWWFHKGVRCNFTYSLRITIVNQNMWRKQTWNSDCSDSTDKELPQHLTDIAAKRLTCVSHDILNITSTWELSAVDRCQALSTVCFHTANVGCYMLTPTGFSSRNWNGTWRLTLLCSTTRWPRRCDAPTTRTVSPLSKTTSPLASSEITRRAWDSLTDW